MTAYKICFRILKFQEINVAIDFVLAKVDGQYSPF